MSSATADNFFADNAKYLVVALVLHVVAGVLLTVTMNATRQPVAPAQLAIKATIVDNSAKRIKREKEQAEAERLERERRDTEQKQREQAEEKRQEEERQETKRAEEKRVEEKRQQQLVADKKLKAEAERQSVAKKKAADDKKRADEIKTKQADKQKAERDAREQAQREAELKRQLADEEGLQQAKNAGALNQYVAILQQRIGSNWNKPDSARPGILCVVKIKQTAGGEVLSATVGQCNGDQAVRQSIEAAVYRSSPLPLPNDMRVFNREINLTLRPES